MGSKVYSIGSFKKKDVALSGLTCKEVPSAVRVSDGN